MITNTINLPIMKAKRLISLLVLMLNITEAVWAARTAPTLPAAQTLQSGRTYYLYNIDSQLFLHRRSSSDVNLDADGSAVTFTSRSDKGDGAYTCSLPMITTSIYGIVTKMQT